MCALPNPTSLEIAKLAEVVRAGKTGQYASLPSRTANLLETLCLALRSPDLLTRILAADVLHDVGDPSCVVSLLGVLDDSEVLVRKAALRALGRICELNGEALIHTLNDPADAVRVTAVEALRSLRDLQAIPQLYRVLRDDCPEVVAAAAGALGDFKSPDSVAPLCRELRRSVRTLPEFVYGRPDASWTWEERQLMERKGAALLALVNAVIELGDPSSAGTLCELIGEAFWRNVALAAARGVEELLPRLSAQQLAAAIPVLKNQLPPWTFESRENREVFRRVLRDVQARYREVGNLPVPSQTPKNPTTQLPRPSLPMEADPTDYPIPSAPR